MNAESFHDLLNEIKQGLKNIYGDQLKGIYLFGSYARRTETPESDVDILIVITKMQSYSAEVNRTSSLSSQLSLKYGLSISKVFLSESDWIEKRTPFLDNIREQAIAA